MRRFRNAARELAFLVAIMVGAGSLGYSGCSDDDDGVEPDPAGPPTAITEPASAVRPNGVRLNARVYPNGAATTVYFDLGLDTGYGSRTDSLDVVAGWDTVAVHVDVDGLAATTGYHCRAAAFNRVGSAQGDDESFTTTAPNAAPTTTIPATPPDLDQTSYEVEFFWNGLDSDGKVVGFEWRMSDNGADGVIDVADTLGLDWHWTTVRDSLFVVTADLDSFPAEPSLSWQTHTFFVRAVDDVGARDATPALVSFTATTQPPTIQITSHGGSSTTCIDVAGVTEVLWTGEDPDASNKLPVEVRWTLLEVDPPGGGDCWSQGEFESEDPFASVASDDPRWSDWLPYAQTPGIFVPSRPAGTAALLGVQARDAAGAVTPSYAWNVNALALRFTTAGRVPSTE